MSYFPDFTDSEPTEKGLEVLVCRKVEDYDALGAQLNLEPVQIEMFKKVDTDPLVINRKILYKWKEEETAMPTTWRTLIEALRRIEKRRLVRQITKELKTRS